jgi:hypothetical protein
MKLSNLAAIFFATTAVAAPIFQGPYTNETAYSPLQYLTDVKPLPQENSTDLGEVTSNILDHITHSASLMSLVDCAEKGIVDGGKEIFHVLEGDVNGLFMKDSASKALWAIFGDNTATTQSTPNLVQYIPKLVADGLNKIDFKCPGCMVQESEMLALDVVNKDLPIFLREVAINPDYNIYIAGKAAGAGIAALTGNEVSLANNVVSLITFGGTKFANIALAEYMNNHYGKNITEDLNSYSNNTYLRVTTEADPTPLYPILSSGFAHAGQNVHLEDVANATKAIFTGEWSPTSDGILIKNLVADVKNVLKTAFSLPTAFIPNIQQFAGNLLCPVSTYQS